MLITVSKKVCLFMMMGILFKIYFLVYRHETPEVAKRSNKRGDDYSAAVSSNSSSSSLVVSDASSTSSAIAVTERFDTSLRGRSSSSNITSVLSSQSVRILL